MIFQAISFDDAIAQAIKEARSYSRQTRFVNMYGQSVRMPNAVRVQRALLNLDSAA